MRVADLYAEPPERFIGARDALADSLRATDPMLATHVQGLRKPTLALWVVNQLARRHAADVHRFVAEKARDRALLERLLKQAIKIFAEEDHRPDPVQLRRVEETLLASAMVSPEDRDALLEGRLGRPLVLGDIDTLLALAASRGASERPRPGPPRAGHRAQPLGSVRPSDPATQRAEALRVAKKAEEIARATAERLAAAAHAAEERADRARVEARAAQRAAEASAREAKKKATAARNAARVAMRRKAA